jgi:hypothetical protein
MTSCEKTRPFSRQQEKRGRYIQAAAGAAVAVALS